MCFRIDMMAITTLPCSYNRPPSFSRRHTQGRQLLQSLEKHSMCSRPSESQYWTIVERCVPKAQTLRGLLTQTWLRCFDYQHHASSETGCQRFWLQESKPLLSRGRKHAAVSRGISKYPAAVDRRWGTAAERGLLRVLLRRFMLTLSST